MKSKLPFRKKKLEEDELAEVENERDQESTDPSHQSGKTATGVSPIEEDLEEDQPLSFLDKLKAKFKITKKVEDDTSRDLIKAKKPNHLIKIIIALALVVLILEPFLFPEDEVPEVQIVLKPRGKRVMPKETTEVPPAAAPSEVAVEVTPKASDDTLATTPVSPEGSNEAVTIEVTPVPENNEASVPLPVPENTETPAPPLASETTEAPVPPSNPETIAPSEAPSVPEENKETPSETSASGETGGSGPQDSIDGQDNPVSDDTMTDKILQDLENQVKTSRVKEDKKEYVPPPDYEYKGRGLVYNCKGKHWACVDAPSYKVCEDNSSSTKFLKKPVECYPFNVYETSKGCEKTQNRMVSSSATTSFCQEN